MTEAIIEEDIIPEELEGYEPLIAPKTIEKTEEDLPTCSAKDCDNPVGDDDKLCRECKVRLGIDLHANRSKVPMFAKRYKKY